MSLKKKILTVAIYVLVALIIPAVILLIFVDSSESYIYLLVFSAIIFTTFGIIIMQINSIKADVNKSLEELKVQNAALAFRFSQIKRGGKLEEDGNLDITVEPDFKPEKKKSKLEAQRDILKAPKEPEVFDDFTDK